MKGLPYNIDIWIFANVGVDVSAGNDKLSAWPRFLAHLDFAVCRRIPDLFRPAL